jgi:hypothetical protein
MPKATFEFSLKLKDCDKVFKEGFPPGVVVIQEIEFDLPDRMRDWDKHQLARTLVDQEHDFIERHVEVVVKEI